jgi:hypothetical protein
MYKINYSKFIKTRQAIEDAKRFSNDHKIKFTSIEVIYTEYSTNHDPIDAALKLCNEFAIFSSMDNFHRHHTELALGTLKNKKFYNFCSEYSK